MKRLGDIDTSRAALIVMHFQQDVFDILFDDGAPELIARTNRLISLWRQLARPLVFANFALGEKYEGANHDNKLLQALMGTDLFRTAVPAEGLNVRSDDKIYTCPRINVFHGTSLDVDLRRQGVDTLVMAGVTSSGVLFSTVGWASDADYRICIVEDCCFDPDLEAHEALFRTSFATRGEAVHFGEELEGRCQTNVTG